MYKIDRSTVTIIFKELHDYIYRRGLQSYLCCKVSAKILASLLLVYVLDISCGTHLMMY